MTTLVHPLIHLAQYRRHHDEPIATVSVVLALCPRRKFQLLLSVIQQFTETLCGLRQKLIGYVHDNVSGVSQCWGVAVAWTTQPQHHAVELMVQSRWGLRFTSSADKHWLAFRSVEIAEVVLMKGRWETNNIDPVTYTLKRQ